MRSLQVWNTSDNAEKAPITLLTQDAVGRFAVSSSTSGFLIITEIVSNTSAEHTFQDIPIH